MKNNRGGIKYINGFPNELRAVNSDLSDNPPVSIIEASRIASGKAIGTKVIVEYHKSSIIMYHSNPLPIKSSIYFHRNCINKMKITTENVKKNGRINDEKINFLNMFKCNFVLKL